MPSTLSSKIYNVVQAKYFEYTVPASVKPNKSKKNVEVIEHEKWSKGKKRKRNGESYYFNNHDFLKIGNGIKYNFDYVECPEFEKIYGSYINQCAEKMSLKNSFKPSVATFSDSSGSSEYSNLSTTSADICHRPVKVSKPSVATFSDSSGSTDYSNSSTIISTSQKTTTYIQPLQTISSIKITPINLPIKMGSLIETGTIVVKDSSIEDIMSKIDMLFECQQEKVTVNNCNSNLPCTYYGNKNNLEDMETSSDVKTSDIEPKNGGDDVLMITCSNSPCTYSGNKNNLEDMETSSDVKTSDIEPKNGGDDVLMMTCSNLPSTYFGNKENLEDMEDLEDTDISDTSIIETSDDQESSILCGYA